MSPRPESPATPESRRRSRGICRHAHCAPALLLWRGTGNAFSVEARVFREAGWVLAGTPTGSLRLYLGATVVQIDPDDKPEPSS